MSEETEPCFKALVHELCAFGTGAARAERVRESKLYTRVRVFKRSIKAGGAVWAGEVIVGYDKRGAHSWVERFSSPRFRHERCVVCGALRSMALPAEPALAAREG